MNSKSRKKSIIPVLLLFLFLIAGTLIIWIGIPFWAESIFGPADGALTDFQRWTYSLRLIVDRERLISGLPGGGQEVELTIDPGESIFSISQKLESAGIINDGAAFRNYLIYKGMDSAIRAGDYILSPSLPAIDIAAELESVYTTDVPFFIYPGWRAEEIAESLSTSGIEVSVKDFLEVVKASSQYALPALISSCPSAEGFLFPGEYTIPRQITAEKLVSVFIQRFIDQVPETVINGIEEQGLTLCEGVNLASIIQKETFMDDERARIASVFFNRLNNGIKLETDPTVQYALGFSKNWGGWWKTPLMQGDLDVNSPFNTYRNPGLPPAPISNPDLSSLQAVAFPEQTPYFFFRAKCDGAGYHDFSITFEEHLNKACE